MSVCMADRIRLIIDTDETIRLAVRLAALKDNKSPSEIVNAILRKALASEIVDSKKYTAKKTPGKSD